MPRRAPIPPELAGNPFSIADALRVGLSKSRLRGDDLARPFHGVRATELDSDSILDLCRAFEPALLSGQVFSHVTALSLLGAPLPRESEGRLHVSVLFPRTPPRGNGIHGHSLRRLPTHLVLGLPVSDSAAAWCQSAALLRREDLVAVGDFLVTGNRRDGIRESGLTSIESLARATTENRGSPGAGRMAWALPRIRSGVDSRPETLLRLELIRRGLRNLVTDHPIEVEGGLTLHADLAFVVERIAIEYEGDAHRVDPVRWARDIRRYELMENAGWRVVRVTAQDLFVEPDLLEVRIRTVLSSRRAEMRSQPR
jgi:very-short-patch-repair endonuclease